MSTTYFLKLVKLCSAALCVAAVSPTHSTGEVISRSLDSSTVEPQVDLQKAEGDAQDVVRSRKYFRKYVMVCSNITALTASNLQDFLLQVGHDNNTKITSKFINMLPPSSKISVFVASNGIVDSDIKNCLNRLPRAAAIKIIEGIERQSRATTSGSRMVGAEYLSDIYSPPKATWEYYMTDDGVNVRSLVSIESEPYRSIHAAAHFFGLDPSLCDMSQAFEIFEE